MMRKKCLKSNFFLKLLLCSNLTYETKIVTKYNKNADKMATKMAVYHKKYKKLFPETDKVQEFACKMLILLIFKLQTSSL